MAKPTRPTARPSNARPSRQLRPDPIDAALLKLCGVILDRAFDGSDILNEYLAFAAGTSANLGEAVTLHEAALPDNGEARLSMIAGSPTIGMRIRNSKFTANIVVQYDPLDISMIQAQVASVEGDRKLAGKLADKWFDELDILDDDDEDEFFGGDDDPGEPPPSSPANKAMVDRLARNLAREMKRKTPDLMSQQADMLALEDSPQSLWPILDGMVAACTAKPRDDALIAAWNLLLEGQLTLIRYRIDRGWDWAARMVADYQNKLIDIGRTRSVPPDDFAAMVGALGAARIAVTEETRTALADAGMIVHDLQAPPAGEIQDMIRTLLDQTAAEVSNPFDVVEGFGDVTRVMPSELRALLTEEFALSRHAVLRDAVPIMLLAEDQQVRRSAAAALERIADSGTMSPETLRRTIAIRNWMPDADRAPVDRTIRKARTNNIECAQWPPARELTIMASTIDGSGAQSIVLIGPTGKKSILAGLLLKLSTGVDDVWCNLEASRKDIAQALSALSDAAPSCQVDRGYLDSVVQNAIAIGAAAGRPPAVSLLQIAELIGGAGWQDRKMDVAGEAQRLFDALPNDRRSPAAVEASLRRSADWVGKGFAETWFIDDAEVRAIVRDARKDVGKAANRLLTEVLPKRRAEWAERCLLLALRSQATTDRDTQAYAEDFIVLAHTLSGNLPLTDVPPMAAIARYTATIAQANQW